MALFLALLPVVMLVVLMTSPWPRRWLPMSGVVALPLAAGLAYAVQWTPPYAGADGAVVGLRIHAAVVEGMLSALTPLGIVFGAVLFFKTMEVSGALGVLTGRVRRVSPDPVAQLVLIGWSFSFLIEGLSGFGTPAALAAPILVGLGFPAVRVAAMCLVMNSVPVTFGAVGTPVWFGLGGLGLTAEEMAGVRVHAAGINVVAALVVPVMALGLVVPWREIRRRIGFVWGVVLATVLPYAAVAVFSVEFPSIVGGMTGLLAGAVLARRGWGGVERPRAEDGGVVEGGVERMAVWKAVMPVVAVVVVLGLTRVEALGVKGLLNRESPSVRLTLWGLGEAWVSVSGVVGLRGILGTDAAWKMALLYVPFIVPFVVVSVLAGWWMGLSWGRAWGVWRETAGRLMRAAVALVGALVLVKLLMLDSPGDGAKSPVLVMGEAMAGAAGGAWPGVAALLGALGAFFSGSATVSNLTFGGVQQAVAGSLGLPVPGVLALQTVGASLGNMVCVHNIVAVAAVLGIGEKGREGGVGEILRMTAGPMLVYAGVSGGLGLVLVR